MSAVTIGRLDDDKRSQQVGRHRTCRSNVKRCQLTSMVLRSKTVDSSSSKKLSSSELRTASTAPPELAALFEINLLLLMLVRTFSM